MFDRINKDGRVRRFLPDLMTKLLTALVAASALTPFLHAEDKAPAPAAPAPAKTEALTPEKKKLFLQAFGWIVSKRAGLAQLQFTEEEIADVLVGAKQGALGQGEDFPEKMRPLEQEYMAFLQLRAEAARAEEMKKQAVVAEKNNAEGKAALEKLKKDDKSVVFETVKGADGKDYEYGYKILADGAGDKPKETDTVKVKYTGKLLDGAVFDSSDLHGGQPAEFPLNGVIAGWTRGMQKIAKGGKATLWIPAGLGYGDQGAGEKIKPGATLVFDVELVDITKPEAPKAEEAPKADAPAAK